MKKYVLVEWPESQELMEHERFNECLIVQDIEDHIEVGGSAYMCPEDLYEKIFNTDSIKNLRIGNMEFKRSSYLIDPPDFPNWSIDCWYPNPLYGRENEYKKQGDFYIQESELYPIRHHKSCFKKKETCYTVASFVRDSIGNYELRYITDRPLNLSAEDFSDFLELVKYGYKELNKMNNEEE